MCEVLDHMVTASLPQVFVVGDGGVGKSFVLERILGLAGTEGTDEAIWNADTKYYSADVRLNTMDAVEVGQSGPSCDAVVMVFNAGDAHTSESVKVWWRQANVDDDAVRIMVANHVAPLPSSGTLRSESAAQLRHVEEWCHSELVEFLEMPHAPGSPEVCECTTRIVEALHAHRWPGMTLKPRPSRMTAAEVAPRRTAGTAGDSPADVAAVDFLEDASEDEDSSFAILQRRFHCVASRGIGTCPDRWPNAFRMAVVMYVGMMNGVRRVAAEYPSDSAHGAGMQAELLAADPARRRDLAAEHIESLLELLGATDLEDDEAGSSCSEGEVADRNTLH